jgi:hypothetical protein
VASLGHGGVTGVSLGTGGNDTTSQFLSFMNANTSAAFDLYETRASFTLTPAFLANYDVLLVQWLADGLTAAPTGGFDGTGYWTFTSQELAAVASWVAGGGGIVFLTGYDADRAGEVGATNPLLGAVSDLAYNTDDVFGTVETGNGALCLGDSVPVGGWPQVPPIGAGITFVGGFHGHSIKTGANAIIDDQDPVTSAVWAAHENKGSGSVFAYSDEWVTYSSQWDPSVEPAAYCSSDAGVPSAADPTSRLSSACTAAQSCPSVQVAYQIPQFWANVLSYASRSTQCPVNVLGAVGR